MNRIRMLSVVSIVVILSMIGGPAAAQGPDNSNKSGPTTAEAKMLIGVDVQRISTEHSAFTRRTYPQAEMAICPVGAICTFHTSLSGVDAGVKVFLGDDVTREEMALTVRFVEFYPPTDAVHNACLLVGKEQLNGSTDDPSFQVDPGNFTCDNGVVIPIVTITTPVTTTVQETEVIVKTACPKFGGQITQMLPNNGCKYAGEVLTAPVPAGWSAQYWNGQTALIAGPGIEITSGELTLYLLTAE